MEDIQPDSTKPSEVITTSTESESFESWTLVNDTKTKKSSNIIIASEVKEHEPSGVEIIENEDKESKSHENDDLSDGISVISDCESAGRVSPSQSLSTANDNEQQQNESPLSYGPLTPPNTPDSSRDQSVRAHLTATVTTGLSISTGRDQSSRFVEFFTLSNVTDRPPEDRESISPVLVDATDTDSLLSFRFRISKVFIISILIALIACVGHLRYSEFYDKVAAPINLEKRLENLELQNNLLRAEIDILSKDLKSMQNQKFMKNNEKEKNWRSNGDYKRSERGSSKNKNNLNGDFQRYENPTKMEEKIIKEDINNAQASVTSGFESNDVQPLVTTLPPSASLPTYCKGENLWCSQDTAKGDDSANGLLGPGTSGKPIYQQDHQNILEHEQKMKNGKEYKTKEGKNKKKDEHKNFDNNSKESHEHKKFDKRYGDSDYKKYDNSKEQQYKKYNPKYEMKRGGSRDDSKEKFDKKRQNDRKKTHNDSDYDDDDDNDNDYDYSHIHDLKSSERRYGDHDDNREYHNSKEYEKRSKIKNKSGEKYDTSKNQKGSNDSDSHQKSHHQHDDWHEKMMQHRENIRKKYKNDNNWYLERGSSREEARIFEEKGKVEGHDGGQCRD